MSSVRKIYTEPRVTVENSEFDEYSSKYECCCHSMHSKTAIRILVVLQYILAAACLIGFIVEFFTSHVSWKLLFGFGIFLFQAVFNHSAIKWDSRGFLVPPMIIQVVFVFLWTINLIASIYVLSLILSGEMPEFFNEALKDYPSEDTESFATTVEIFLVVVSTLAIVIHLWVLYVLYKFYVYLKDKKKSQRISYSRLFQA